MALVYLIIVAVAYLIGAIPVGAIVVRMYNIDITTKGSGKTGATNVLRTVGWGPALGVALGDLLKGILAVLAARLIIGAAGASNSTMQLFGVNIAALPLAELLAAVFAVAGHVWSVWLRIFIGRWGGGRGVVTAAGAMLLVNPWVILIAAVVAIPIVAISRYVSLGSILGAATGGLVIIVLVAIGGMDWLYIFFLALPIFIIVAHKDNIERLMRGTERKLGERA
jgi:acyl phosphate:glycerol-3-phosphate acyltransferase